jgi:hypothetical protein
MLDTNQPGFALATSVGQTASSSFFPVPSLAQAQYASLFVVAPSVLPGAHQPSSFRKLLD